MKAITVNLHRFANIRSFLARAALPLLILGAILVVVLNADEPKPESASETYFDTEGGRQYYLGLCGWEVEPFSAESVVIPKTLSSAYEEYERLQLEQGFSLENHAGDAATLYVYSVLNHPQSSENVYASLLVHDDSLIGGDIALWEPEGFIHGLDMHDMQT